MRYCFMLILILLLVLPCAAEEPAKATPEATVRSMPAEAEAAVEVSAIDIVNFGRYTATRVRKTADTGSAIGYKTESRDIVFIEKSDTIVAAPGTKFGVAYVISGRPAGERVDITVKYIHPPMTNAVTGKIYTTQEVVFSKKAIGKEELAGYDFDEPWEIVPGKWTIQFYYNGRLMAEKDFKVTRQ